MLALFVDQIKFFLRGGRAFLKREEILEYEEGVVSFDKEAPLNEEFLEVLKYIIYVVLYLFIRKAMEEKKIMKIIL